jgi:hypothetical protein
MTAMTDVEGDQDRRIVALAERLRASGSLGRSDLMNRLFDFLLEQSLAGRSPKEFEVAQEVFGKDTEFDMAQDASVRVYIHRLRKKLDEIAVDESGERLTIPRGEYRLAIGATGVADVEAVPAEASADRTIDTPPVEPAPRGRPSGRMLAALGLALAIGIVIGASAWFLRGRSAMDPLATTTFWKPFASAPRLSVVVVGDYYIFGEAPEGREVTRLVREFSINSREDLDQYMMEYPAVMGRYVDLDLHYLPTSTGYALSDLLPVADAFTMAAGGGHARILTMSRLTPEFLKRGNIVYVGFLSSLGLLRDPVFKASGFAIGASYDELIDKATGKHYVSNSDAQTDSHSPRRDYAYIASFPGPSGNRILIVAGTRDPAVMQAAEVASDKAQLDQIAARSGNAPAFEALYEVSTLGTLNVGSNLLIARPLKVNGLWVSGDGSQSAFPDQMPSMDVAPPPAKAK